MPRKQYYYNPFESRDDKEIKDTEDKYAGKANCRVIKLVDLKYIEATSTLLIDGHGAAGTGAIVSKKSGGGIEEVKVGTLFSQLKNNQLGADHVKIRMLGCYCGIGKDQNPSFAAQLAYLLGSVAKYSMICVGGYTVGVFTDPNSRALLDLDDGPVENTSKSGYVRWYDGKKNLVEKPSVDSDPNAYNPAFPSTE